MKEMTSEVEINATPDRVWQILTDFERYPEWNPFIKRLEGNPSPGAQIEVEMHPPGGRPMTFKPRVLAAEAPSEFRWIGHFGPKGIFDGEHSFKLEPRPEGGVRLVQSERFTGVLAPLLMVFIGKSTQRGFEAMNEALKQRAEG